MSKCFLVALFFFIPAVGVCLPCNFIDGGFCFYASPRDKVSVEYGVDNKLTTIEFADGGRVVINQGFSVGRERADAVSCYDLLCVFGDDALAVIYDDGYSVVIDFRGRGGRNNKFSESFRLCKQENNSVYCEDELVLDEKGVSQLLGF